jgi:Transposase DDE domain group 1
MNSSSARRLVVEGGGRQVVGHAGLHALALFSDTVGVGAALSPAIPWTGERAPFHDRGKVLTHAMLMLAGGGEACSDIEQLSVEDRLFGDVASDSTLYRTMTGIKPATLDGLRSAFAGIRHQMWTEHLDNGRAVVLDVDSSLVQIHSENKDEAAPTFNGGFGFHPMFCFADATGETLAARLRPGNAGANTITDLLQVVDDAIAQLPTVVAVGHRDGDAADAVQRRV